MLSERVSFPDPVPGEALHSTLSEIVPLIRKENLVPSSADLDGALQTLLEPSLAERVLANGGA
ncbi:hypothetical protein OO015_05610 [Thermomicrobium sp. 4228-Ro]|uniref:hypothetical protein n=1 Tax=Thermomicrobium sp. 4228-Ro TaxID=2993937 RepID=UPI0022492FB6|nr:hypothetical protein [Thermomicrobium sp. 4228-Ro]MCX2726971.1 hypothetical protein [Thermomicrobium sp. 4228-Ro]